MKEQEYFGGAASNYFCNVDGQTGLAAVPSNFVDLVLTDPPYGIADSAKLTKRAARSSPPRKLGVVTLKIAGPPSRTTTSGSSLSLLNSSA